MSLWTGPCCSTEKDAFYVRIQSVEKELSDKSDESLKEQLAHVQDHLTKLEMNRDLHQNEIKRTTEVRNDCAEYLKKLFGQKTEHACPLLCYFQFKNGGPEIEDCLQALHIIMGDPSFLSG